MTEMNENWTCPICGGKWIRNFVFDHDRAACAIGTAEDTVQYADFEALKVWRRGYERPSSMAERLLAEVVAPEPLPENSSPVTWVEPLASGIHRRVVAGIDPDLVSLEQQA